jgi:nucleoid-associated protein YgaU
MALSVKLAMLISFGAVGVISWVVQVVDPPQVRRPLPFVVTDVRGRLVAGPHAPGLVLGAQADRRSGLARQLQHVNPLDAQATENRVNGPALALAPPAQLPPGDDQPAMLPPLVCADGPGAGNGDLLAVAEAAPADSQEIVLIAGGEAATETGPAPAASARTLRAAKGDTLLKIAAREYGQKDARLTQLLSEANPQLKARGNRVRAGEELVIPDAAAAQRWLVAGREAASPTVATATEGGPKTATADARWYTIQKNDSLQRIAQQQLKDSGRWREIQNLNRTLNPSRIQPGTRIKLPPVLKVVQR